MSAAPEHRDQTGPIGWMAGNSVAANLLMVVLLVGGLLVGLHIKQEIFPEFSEDMVNVSVSYPGASPEEVERAVVLPVEEAIQGLDGIKEVTSTASEGSGAVSVEALDGADVTRLWQDIEAEVNRIATFPDEAEDPVVSIATHRREVINLALYGDAGERALRETAEAVRDELLQDGRITQVELRGARDYEIHVEVGQANLRRYGLTLEDVADAVAKASVELGGGTVETRGGEVLLRVKDRREAGAEYARVPVLTRADGSRVLLEDLGAVREGFEDSDVWAGYNGKPSIMIDVYRVGDQTPIEVADAAREAVERINTTLPAGLTLTPVMDMSKVFRERADLLLRNAYLGLGLVFLCLALFLEMRLAFWVSMGIPVSFLGSFLFLSMADFSINMVTMFAFLVTLGIVVDDAIVVGENVYSHRREGKPFLQAAVMGAREVAMPVVFSVLTNMVAFLPLYFVPGIMGKVFGIIPIVVVCVFGVSLVESLFVLPAHLSHHPRRALPWPLAPLGRRQARFSKGFETFITRVYGGLLAQALRHRWSVVCMGLALLLAMAGYVQSGRMGLELMPKVESDFAFVEAVLPLGSPKQELNRVEQRLVDSAQAVIAANGGPALAQGIFSRVNEDTVNVQVFLESSETRPMYTREFVEKWREAAGTMAGLESVQFLSDRGGPGSGKALTVQLSHRDTETLYAAGRELARYLEGVAGVSDMDDGSARGKRQFDIRILPAGERMGLTSREVANQIRHAFYGVEALRQLRGRNEVTVRVRLPESERASEATLENLVLRAPGGGEILLREATELTEGRAYTSIQRQDGRRIISVTADVSPSSQTTQVMAMLKAEALPGLTAAHPGLTYSFEGKQADIRDSVQSLMQGLALALLAIFALLAVPFRSYVQPLIIMFCIPFGVVGAILGHLVMGYSLSIMSLFGVVALAGVLVNDSLVLIDFTNRRRREGLDAGPAVHSAGVQRFRPIMLTTLTTFGGLAPMIFETSRQARFLIPMALSLGYGILFATFITLLMVPCLYLILDDLLAWLSRHGRAGEECRTTP